VCVCVCACACTCVCVFVCFPAVPSITVLFTKLHFTMIGSSERFSAGRFGFSQLWNPRASACAFVHFFFCDGLDERSDAAEDREDTSTFVLKSSDYTQVTTTTRLNFATVEDCE
jgi:hypothetical protein